MPRKLIESFSVEYRQALDENGDLDPAFDPGLPAEDLRRLYRTMLLARLLDRRMVNLQQQGRIGTFPGVQGQEAGSVGFAYTLGSHDWLVPSFRETSALLWRGLPPKHLLLYYMGLEEGNVNPAGEQNLPTGITVGSQPLHAVGIAWAAKLRDDDSVSVVFFGDGATSEGDFHEACNMAGVFQVPVVFVCVNNQYAISVPRAMQSHSQTLAQKAIGYGFPGVQIDGNDLLGVIHTAREAVDRARAGQGPTLVECLTYRLCPHTTADDPRRYRTDEEVQIWQRRDPILRIRKHLEAGGLWTPAWQEELEGEIKTEIDDAVREAEEQVGQVDPLEMFDHVYEELSPELQAQKEEAAAFLAAHAHAGANGRP